MNNLINMLLKQNPQFQTFMKQMNGNPAEAKKQVMQMVQSGNVKEQDLNGLKGLADQFGLGGEFDKVLSEIKFPEKKGNRW